MIGFNPHDADTRSMPLALPDAENLAAERD